MNQVGFDSEKYIRLQSEHIRERINQFGGKLYLEFGGKLFDDYHASRVLPGFAPDNKIKMLLALRDQAEIVIAITPVRPSPAGVSSCEHDAPVSAVSSMAIYVMCLFIIRRL